MSDIEDILKNYHKDLEKRRDLDLKVRKDIQAGAFNPDKISQDFSKLRSEFSNVFDYLEERFHAQNTAIVEINKNFYERKKQLEDLYRIQITKDTLGKIEQQITTKEEDCINLQKQIETFEKNLERRKSAWNEEQLAIEDRITALELRERDMLQKSAELEESFEKEAISRKEKVQKDADLQKRLLEEELFQLKKAAEVERETDLRAIEAKKEALDHEILTHKEKMALEKESLDKEVSQRRDRLEEEIESKRLEAEKQYFEKESELSSKNIEVAELRAKVAEFPEKLDKSVREAEKQTATQMMNKYTHLMALAKKEHSSELEIHKQRLLMLEGNQQGKDAMLEKQDQKIQHLESELSKLNQKAQTLLVQLNERSKEQENRTLGNKPYTITQTRYNNTSDGGPRIVRNTKR